MGVHTGEAALWLGDYVGLDVRPHASQTSLGATAWAAPTETAEDRSVHATRASRRQPRSLLLVLPLQQSVGVSAEASAEHYHRLRRPLLTTSASGARDVAPPRGSPRSP